MLGFLRGRITDYEKLWSIFLDYRSVDASHSLLALSIGFGEFGKVAERRKQEVGLRPSLQCKGRGTPDTGVGIKEESENNSKASSKTLLSPCPDAQDQQRRDRDPEIDEAGYTASWSPDSPGLSLFSGRQPCTRERSQDMHPSIEVRGIRNGDEHLLYPYGVLCSSGKRMQPAEVDIAFQNLATDSRREMSRTACVIATRICFSSMENSAIKIETSPQAV